MGDHEALREALERSQQRLSDAQARPQFHVSMRVDDMEVVLAALAALTQHQSTGREEGA